MLYVMLLQLVCFMLSQAFHLDEDLCPITRAGACRTTPHWPLDPWICGVKWNQAISSPTAQPV